VSRSRDLPVSGIVPQPTMLPLAVSLLMNPYSTKITKHLYYAEETDEVGRKPDSCWFPSLKHRQILNVLHGVTSQKREPFVTADVRTLDPTDSHCLGGLGLSETTEDLISEC
jgi:hypothetical protein